MRRSSGFYGGSRLPAILMLLVLAGSCVLAYRHFFQRQGEAAASLIPNDALMVATLDLKPSPEQVSTFTHIHEALHREKMDTLFDTALTSMLSNSPIGKDLRPYVTTSMAFATLKSALPPGNTAGIASNPANAADAIGLFAVSDSGSVRDILVRDAQKFTQDGMDYYQVKPGDNVTMTVVGDYLVVASRASALLRVVKVHRGDMPSIATQPDFQHGRATLPGDANLMIFIPPNALRQATATLTTQNRNGRAPATPWMVIGMSARAGGIETYVQVPIDAPAGSDLSNIAPFDLRLLNRLPPNAYGLMALSQPSRYWSHLITAGGSAASLVGGNQQNTDHAVNEGIAHFERETGMSIARDVLPGFHGDALLAIYPETVGDVKGVDGLVVLDDANGADPAALADKVRGYIERRSAEQGRTPVHFISQAVNGATIWTLDTNSQEQLRQTLGAAATQAQQGISGIVPGMGAAPGASAAGAPAGFASARASQSMTINLPGGGTETIISKPDNSVVTTIHKADGSIMTTVTGPNGTLVTTNTGPNGNGSIQATVRTPEGASIPMPNGALAAPASPIQRALGNKTLVYAQIGHAVLIASSQSMMDRALSAYTRGTGGLAEDAAYAQMAHQIPAGTQTLLMVDLPGIMEAFRPMVTNSMSGNTGDITPQDVMHMFGQHTGIIGAQQYDGKVAKAYFFMPLDYDKVIRMIGAAQKAVGGHNAMPVPPPAVTGNGGVVQ